jgi:hypothetical protein
MSEKGLSKGLGARISRLFRRLMRRKLKIKGNPAVSDLEPLLLLQGRIAARANPFKTRIRNLADVEFKVFSQWGEDGIIDWLIAHIKVPNERFVEFGVEQFTEANCRFLLKNRGWKGLVLDGSERNIALIKAEPTYWKHDLTARSAFVTADNIDHLISDAGFGGPLGLLSIDIDGNDYWIWKALTGVEPAIVVCEYNAVLGDQRPIVVPYSPSFRRLSAHFSGQYFGASIAALKHLALEKGYTFLGTNSNGVNAFFVKDEFAEPALSLLDEVRAFPSRHRDSRDEQGKLTFVPGTRRYELIRDLPVVDITDGTTLQLCDIQTPYSHEWLASMR